MKNIYRLTCLILIIFMSSCEDALDKDKCLKNVRKVYPNSRVFRQEGSSYTFYVIDSSGARKVTTLNMTNANIDDISELIEIK